MGCAFSGLTADAKMLIDRARVESRNHWFTHDRLMPVESIAQVRSSSNSAKKNSRLPDSFIIERRRYYITGAKTVR